MNILFIGTTDIVGGAAKISWALKEALEKEGHNVSMLVADKKSSDPKVKIIPRTKWRKLLGFLLGTESLISTDWILETTEFKRADIVHCHNLHGRFFNLKTLQKMSQLKPIVWTLHDAWALTPHCAHTLESEKMEYGLFACPSINTPPRTLWDNDKNLARQKIDLYSKSRLHLVTPSLWLKRLVEKTILAKQDLRLIYNGIDTATFTKNDRQKARESLRLPLNKKIFLFLADDAKNNTWKGWPYAKEAIKQCQDNPDILFLCVGNRQQHQDEPNVKYAGLISNKRELSEYYSAANALLFTSIAENFPLVILEAMSCGLPIISFDVGGIKEAVSHLENGYIAKYRDSEDLKKGLDWFLQLSDEDCLKIGEKSIEKVRQKFSQQQMIKKYFDLYQELLNPND
jgi:glycosyltransferase involved in cell wall biosynthesis